MMSTLNHAVLTPQTISQLHNSHYAVLDNFLTKDFADLLRQDAEELFTKGNVTQHYFQFGGKLLKKPNVYELDLSGDTKPMVIGSWSEVLGHVAPSFLKQMSKLDCDVTVGGTQDRKLDLDINCPPAIKVQVNTGGGSFPWHYDNPGLPNKRKLTCVVYLNPTWSEGDGGEIVLWPFLNDQIIIPPLHRRAILFYSDRMLHRVLPSNKRRVCFTMWMNGTNVNAKDDVTLSKDDLQFTSYDQAQRFFALSPLQRIISRAVYREEYIESLLQCIVVCGSEIDDEQKNKLRSQHEASIVSILTKLKPLIEEFRRRSKHSKHGITISY